MAENDFFVNFGSNAPQFVRKLKTDLEKAHEPIQLLNQLLDSLDTKGKDVLPPLFRALNGVGAAADRATGGGGGGGAPSAAAMDAAVAAFRSNLDAMAGELRAVVTSIGKVTKQQGRVNRGRGAYVDPDQNWRIVKTKDVQAGLHPNAIRMGTARLSQDAKLINALERLTSGTQPAPHIAGVGKAELDTASVDRLVRAIGEVRDEIRSLGNRPLQTVSSGETATVATTGKGKTAKTAAAAETQAQAEEKDLGAQVEAAKNRVAFLEVQAARLVAVAKQGGGAVNEGLADAAKVIDEQLSAAKADAAKLERQSEGITKQEQKQRRRAQGAADRGPAMSEGEIEKRSRIRQRLDLALDPAAFEVAATGRGANKLSANDLREVAGALHDLGYEAKLTANATKPEMVKKILSARQAMLADYGSNVPESLRLGPKIRPDVVSEDVRQMLASLNITPEHAELDRLAREQRRLGYLSGALPKEPTQRGLDTPPVSKLLDLQDLPSHGFAMSEELQRGITQLSHVFGAAERQLEEMWTSGGSFVRVPHGMVKGGGGSDPYEVARHSEEIRQRMLGTVAERAARDPHFNPLQYDPYEHVKGPKAQENRQVLFAIRRAIDDMDVLGREFVTSADRVAKIDEYLKRANARLEREARGAKLTAEDKKHLERDRTGVPEAEAERAKLLTEMRSAKYQTLGLGADRLETPEYRAGLMQRDIFRAREAADRAAAPPRDRLAYIGDALGQALIGSRLAPGTRETRIKNLGDARWNRKTQDIDFVDPGARTKEQRAELIEFNKARRSAQSLILHQIPAAEAARAAGEDVDVEKLRRKLENKATSVAGHVQSLWGRNMSVEDLLGSGGVDEHGNRIPYQFRNPKNAQAEADRLDARQKQTAREAASVARAKGTPEEKASASLADAKHRLAEAIKQQEKQTTELTKLEAELEVSYDQLSKSDRALVAAADARLARLQQERNALENAWHPRPADKLDEHQDPNYASADATRTYVEAQRQAVAALERQERSQRGVLTRYQKAGTTGEKVTKAEERLAATTSKLATEREALARLEHQAPGRIAAAEAGARSEAALANKYRDRGHSPGEPLDVMGYPSRFGYNADAQTRKRQLDQQLEQARADRARLVGGDTRADLVAELERRMGTRSDIRSKIASARAEGDLKENAGYHAAMEEQGRNEARIKQIQAHLAAEGLGEYDKLAAEIDSTNKIIAHLTAQVAKAEQRLTKAAGREAAAPNAADRVQSTTAEAEDLRRKTKAAEALRRQATDLRNQKRAAGTPEEKAAIQARLDELKKSPSWLLQDQLKPMRTRLLELNRQAAGGGDGGGSKPPTARGGAGGAMGGDGSTNGILREILAAINGVRTTLQTGVRISGGGTAQAVDASGQPISRSRKRISDYATQPKGESDAAKSTDEREAVKAAAAQQRRLEVLAKDEELRTKAVNSAHEQANRIERDRQAESRRGAAITAAQAHAQLQLDQAMARVDEATITELAALERLNREGASAVKIANQQARAYATMDAAMQRNGVAAGDRRSYAQSLLSHANVMPNGQQGPRLNRTAVDEIARSARGMSEIVGPVQGAVGQMADLVGEQGPFGSALTHMFGGHGFWSRIMASTGTFIVRNFTAGFVFGITNALQQVAAEAINTEATFVRVSSALEATGKDVGTLRQDLGHISTEYGTNLNELYDTAAQLTGLFDTSKEIAGATKIVSQLRVISDGALNATEAISTLASITGSYGDELQSGVGGFQHVADVFTSIQNNIGTNVEVTAEGVARLSGLSKELGLSFEQTSVYVAQIGKLTGQQGAAAGEQLSRILGSLQTGRAQNSILKAFQQQAQSGAIGKGAAAGIEQAFATGDIGDVLTRLLTDWNHLTKAQQQNISVTVAGQRQAASWQALVSKSAAVLNDVAKATNANGDAETRMQKITKTLNQQMQILGSNLHTLANNMVRSGILDFLGIFLRITNKALATLNDVLTKINDFTDSNGLTRFLKTATFGIVGFAAAIALVRRSVSGIKGVLSRDTAAALEAGLPIGATRPAGQAVFRPGMAGPTAPTVQGRRPGFFGSLSYLVPHTYLDPRINPQPGLWGRLTGPLYRGDRLGNLSAGLAERATMNRERANMLRQRASIQGEYGVNSAGRVGAQATAYRALAGVQNTASVAAGKLAGSLKGMAAAGLAADAAMIAVGFLLAKLAEQGAKDSELRSKIENAYGKDSADRLRKAKEQGVYVGPFQDLVDQGEARKNAAAVGKNFLTSLLPGGEGPKRAIEKSLGIDIKGLGGLFGIGSNEQSGLGTANKIVDKYRKQIESVGGDQAKLAQIRDTYGKDLDKRAQEIANNSTLSEQEKVSQLGTLEQVRKSLDDQLAGIAQLSLGATKTLTGDNIDNIQKYMDMAQALGGRTKLGGVDFSGAMKDFLSQTGLAEDDPLYKKLKALGDGTSDSIEIVQTQAAAYAEEIRVLEAKWNSLSDKSSDVAVDTENRLATARQNFIQTQNSIVEVAQQNAQTFASLAINTGKGGGAVRAAYAPALAAAKARLQADMNSATQVPMRPPPAGLIGQMMMPGVASQEQIAQDKNLIVQTFQQATDQILQQRILKLQQEIIATADPAIRAALMAELQGLQSGGAGRNRYYKRRQNKFESEYGFSAPASTDQAASNQASIDKKFQEAEAARATALAAIAPQNTLGQAYQSLANANAAKADVIAQGFSKTSVQYQQAVQQQIAAQYAVTQAQGDIAQANANLQAAYANARGDTVGAAKAGLAAANAALAYAKKLSGGARSAEVINAQAQVVAARASIRDARLQDELDTIDFNLQMGKITQSSAISALKQILKTQNLTKQQRRQLMLQIHGMEKEISDSPWNFGEIKLPKPYLMKRYIEEQRAANTKRLDAMVGGSLRASTAVSAATGVGQQLYNDNRNVEILINGGNLDQIRKVLREVVGTPTRTRTTAPRRGRR